MEKKSAVILPPQFAPTAAYFRAIADHDYAFICGDLRHDKRFKSVHRPEVAPPQGALRLTLPLSRRQAVADEVSPYAAEAGEQLLWRHFAISPHGQWWKTMRGTIATYYGAAPYFDYYREFIEPFIDESWVGRSIVEFDCALTAALLRALRISTPVSASMPLNTEQLEITDLSRQAFDDGPGILHPLLTLGPDILK